jgi:glycerophosphoryl diester phosphodiesterase
MLRIGHRGACGYAPENTLASFKKALELTVDYIEFDVRLSKDHSLVLMHDDKVNRTTSGTGLVIEKTLKELKQLDAGNGEKIPTLQEVLDLIDKKTKVNIELKEEKTAKPVAQLIENYVQTKGWSYDDFLVSSFNHQELHVFKTLEPQVKIGALIVGIPLDYAKFGQNLKAYSINISMEFISKKFVDDTHARGLKILVFTVNDKDDIERVKNLNVDGIFSNFPDRIA